jgi:uncharacterized lipoprotein YehR (DUF1307 family)
MKKVLFSAAALLVMALTLTSCGGSGPKDNAKKFLEGLYHMDFAAAKEVSTDETKKQVEAYEQMMGMMQQNAKDEAKKIKVDVMEPKVEGDNATVEYKLSNDPTAKTLKMVKKDGKWLAAWTKMDMGGANMGDQNATAPATTAPMTNDTAIAPPADGTTTAPANTDTAVTR